MDPLVDRHDAVHAFLEEQVWLTLEALVARDLPAARARFARFTQVLERHMRFEDQHVLPRYAPLAPKDGPGRLDHVQGDHVILNRHVDEGSALLADDAASLRDALRRLPTFYRLLNVLEHHTMRERHVYGVLAEHGFADDALRRGLESCLVDADATV